MRQILLFLGFFVSTGLFAEDLPIDSNVRYGKLSNGLTYVIRNNSLPESRANFYLVQNVGATLEEDNQNGLAHFLEHMAFNGTKHFPDKLIIDYLETVGVKFGENINAYTSYDETVYHLDNVPTIREAIIDSCLLVLHDWSGYISLLDEEIDKERGVIREEWRTRDNAMRRTYFQHLTNTLPETKYAIRNIIGDTAIINNFSYKELRDYYHTWYRPDLQCVIIVGDIDVDKIEKKIKKLWKDVPEDKKRTFPDRKWDVVKMNDTIVASVVKDKETQHTIISADFRRPAVPYDQRRTYKNYIDNVNMSILTRAINARFSDMMEDPNNPYLNMSVSDDLEFPSLQTLSFGVLAKPDSTVEATKALFREINRLYQYGLNDEEIKLELINLERTLRDAYTERNKVYNDDYTDEYIRFFTEGEAIPGIEYEYKIVADYLPTVQTDSLNNILKSLINVHTVLFLSCPDSDETIADNTELTKLYEETMAEEIEPYEEEIILGDLVEDLDSDGEILKRETGFLDSEVLTLNNGIRVHLLRTDNTENTILAQAVSFGGRSLVDTAEILASRIVSNVANKSGIGDYSESELRKILAGKSAGISVSIGNYTETINGGCMAEDFETLCQLYYLAFNPLRKDTDVFTVAINGLRTNLINRESNPNSAFADTITNIMAGGNPYLSRITKETVDSIRYDDIINIYNSRFGNPTDFTFFFVGNFDKDSVETVLAKYLGALESLGEPEKYVERNLYMPEGVLVNHFSREMETHKASCALIYSGRMDYTRENAISLAILKDLLRMRYTETIREEEGGTYGVHCSSSFDGIVENDYSLMLTFDTDPELIEKLKPMLTSEIEKISTDGPKLDDFDKVKKNLLKARAEQLQDDEVWLHFLVNKTLWDKDIYTDFDSQVGAITPENIKAMAEKVLSDGNLIEVVMTPTE